LEVQTFELKKAVLSKRLIVFIEVGSPFNSANFQLWGSKVVDPVLQKLK